jgi:hypothetical protein
MPIPGRACVAPKAVDVLIGEVERKRMALAIRNKGGKFENVVELKSGDLLGLTPAEPDFPRNLFPA